MQFKHYIFNHDLLIGIFVSPDDNALQWMPPDHTDGQSKLVEVWFRQRLGGIMQQAVNLANFDPDLCRHMASWGHSDLTEWPLRYTIIIFNV